ncbi:MAG TPA: immunoglobulin domain-containing protein, partial [Verrucomicrobiae bacterium]|nr:immunoglobulin domain-containing protein [Verrucomicrobiae bacterium]
TVNASTNGWLQAWIDFDRNGSWTNNAEQVLTNRSLVSGANVIAFAVPSGALAGSTAARFRFSTAANVPVDGDAPDGEVEDHELTLVAETDLAIASVRSTNAIAVGSNLVYAITVTNAGPALAGSVVLNDTLPLGVGFVSAVTSQGDCGLSGNNVNCSLGNLAAGASALVTITVIPTVAGGLTNVVSVSSAATELNGGNNSVATTGAAYFFPVILTAPQSQTVTNGGTASFSVGASATAPRYQWRLNAVALSGATNATLTIPNVQPSQAGPYTVSVSNAVGSVVSPAATLTVLVPVSITTQPASQTVSTGATVVLSVTVTGSAPLTYQWQRNGGD